MIYVYNKKIDDFSANENNYEIGRPHVLSNPYTYLDIDKTKALYKVKTKEDAIERYSDYFDVMYGSNKEFTKAVDEIYEKYKNGEDIYLACWCKQYSVNSTSYKIDTKISCHGDIIVDKLRKRLVKEKVNMAKAAKLAHKLNSEIGEDWNKIIKHD